MEYTVVMFH